MSETAVRPDETEARPESRIDTAGLDGLRVLVTLAERETQAAVTAILDTVDGLRVTFAPPGLVPVAALSGSLKDPEALIFEARDEDQAASWLDAVRRAPVNFRNHLVVLVPSPTKTASIRLLQAGADDVLATRPDPVELVRTLHRARAATHEMTPQRIEEVGDDLDTRLVMFIHAAGGQGATTLAVNTAVQLHNRVRSNNGGACLIDLDLQFGDAHLHLDLNVQSRLLDVVNNPHRLDRRMLDDLMINAPNGLKVLTSPEHPMPLDGFGPETIDMILSLARRRYRYVVVDMPRALTHWTQTALHRADHVFLVTQVNVPALRAARRLLDTIRTERVTRAPVTIIANRYGGRSGSIRLPLQQASRALDRDIDLVVPNDYQVVMESLDQGVPVSTLRPGSRFSHAISEMLDATVGAKARARGGFGGLVSNLTKLGRK